MFIAVLNESEKLSEVIQLGLEVSEIRDIELVLEGILTRARRLVNADAGTIYLRGNNILTFTITQNDSLQGRISQGAKLLYSSSSLPIDRASIAGYVAQTGETISLSDAYQILGESSYYFDKSYDVRYGYRTKSLFTIPLKAYRGEVVGVLQLINAKDGNGTIVSFQKADEPLIMLFASHAAIAIERALLTKAIILRMIGMAQMRDPYETGAHALRVASYAVEIYERWAQRHMISLEEMNKKKDLLKIGAMLHDVGKVAVSDTILKKPARLSPEEFCAMKQHACLGARLFSERQSDFDEACLIVALNHHERWDGKGYPGHIDYMTGKPLKGNANAGEAQGKKAEEIPVFGRIVAIADVYDALCSPRAYKEPYGETKALEILSEEAGKHFDPDMTEDFFAAGPVIREIAERYSEGIDTLML